MLQRAVVYVTPLSLTQKAELLLLHVKRKSCKLIYFFINFIYKIQ